MDALTLSLFVATAWQQPFDVCRARTSRSELFVRAMRWLALAWRNLSTASASVQTKAHTENGVKRTVTISFLNVRRARACVCVCGACIGHNCLMLEQTCRQFRRMKKKIQRKHTGSFSHRSISLSWTSSRMDVYWIVIRQSSVEPLYTRVLV